MRGGGGGSRASPNPFEPGRALPIPTEPRRFNLEAMAGHGWGWLGMAGHGRVWWGMLRAGWGWAWRRRGPGAKARGPGARGPRAGAFINATVAFLAPAAFLRWIQAHERSPASWLLAVWVAPQPQRWKFLKAHMWRFCTTTNQVGPSGSGCKLSCMCRTIISHVTCGISGRTNLKICRRSVTIQQIRGMCLNIPGSPQTSG